MPIFGFLRRLFGTSRSLSADEAKRFLDATPGVIVLDVRSQGEFSGGHLPGAKHVPVGLVPTRAQKMDPAATYLVYCRSGGRSSRAASALSARGFKNVVNLHGGIVAWERRGYPVTKR